MEVPSTIDVIAPSNLSEGYQFQVDAGGGKLFTVQVPPGGVTAGQRFSAIVVQQAPPMPTPSPGPGGVASAGIPTGRWKDEWTNCCARCDAACCLSFWCYTCAVGQLMTRMNLDWKGDSFRGRESEKPSLSTFKIAFIITTVYHVVSRIFSIAGLWYLEFVVGILFAVYYTLITCKTRKVIRKTYSIPTTTCGEDMEDCCCGFWCMCCTSCHMQRHLTDYDQYPPKCCTDTGLGPEAPILTEFFDGAPQQQQQQMPPPPQHSMQQPPPPPPPAKSQSPPPTAPQTNDQFGRENEQTFVVDL